MIDFLINYDEELKNILTSFAILIGGAWTFWRYVLQREGNSKIQFNVDLKVIGRFKDNYIVEVIALVENKGHVRHYVNDFKFDLLYLSDNHELLDGDERINKQLLFEKIIDKRYWIPPNWHRSFIDASVVQEYTYITHIPINALFVIVYANFKYPSAIRFLPIWKSFHTAQKTFNIKEPSTTPTY